MSNLSSNTEWKRWGERDPLWAVSSWKGKQRGGTSAWTEQEFIELGRSDWADFLAQWRQYGIVSGSCIEIGCGAGRMTRHLAATFDKVFALDVSEGMLAKAKHVAPSANIEFTLVGGLAIPQGTESVSAVFSTHVFQHLNRYRDGLVYFKECFRVLKPGGSLMVHLPLHQIPRERRMIGRALRFAWWAFMTLDNLWAVLRRNLGLPLMRGISYPLEKLVSDLEAIGFADVEIRVFSTKSNQFLHPFVLATKPQALV